MPRRAQFFFLAMCVAFSICIFGLLAGMAYVLFAVFAHHRTLDSVLGNSIPFFKTLGAIGVLGFLLFFAFLISSIMGRAKNLTSK
jgi:hypothetical protein